MPHIYSPLPKVIDYLPMKRTVDRKTIQAENRDHNFMLLFITMKLNYDCLHKLSRGVFIRADFQYLITQYPEHTDSLIAAAKVYLKRVKEKETLAWYNPNKEF